MKEPGHKEIYEEWLSNREAARFLNVSTKTLKKYRDCKKIPYYRDERKVRFRKSDLIAYLKRYYNIQE